jgi:hypothetical protein
MEVEVMQLPVSDANGQPLATGDKVQVKGSDRYGAPTGVVIGYTKETHTVEEARLDADGNLKQESEDKTGSKPVRIIIRLANGENDDYRPSAGRVFKIDGDGAPDETDVDAAATA